MTEYKMAYAKTHLASLIRDALAGNDIVIARDESPLVRLVPIATTPTSNARTGGDLEGKVTLPDEFFAPLAGDATEEWQL